MSQTGSTFLIAPPTAAVVSAAEVRTMLSLSSSTNTALLDLMIGAVADTMDAATGGWLGRALSPQTWEYRLDKFPSGKCAIRLPYPVLTELTSVVYVDSAGDEQTLTADTDYRVIGLGGHH